jgi:hypothetical protein
MIPGPIEILGCPNCGELASQETLISGNYLDAVYWTDGKVQAPMMPESPIITRCFSCGDYFWLSEAEKVGYIEKSNHTKQGQIPQEWLNAPFVRFLVEEEYLEVAEKVNDNPEMEIDLRLMAWRAANNVLRNPFPAELRPYIRHRDEQQQNMHRLLNILKPHSPQEVLTIAEIKRELHCFDDALHDLNVEMPEECVDFAMLMRNLAGKKDGIVARLPKPKRIVFDEYGNMTEEGDDY